MILVMSGIKEETDTTRVKLKVFNKASDEVEG